MTNEGPIASTWFSLTALIDVTTSKGHSSEKVEESYVISLKNVESLPVVVVIVASLLLVAMPGAPSGFLLLVVRPGAPSNVLAPSSKARSP